MADDVDPAPDKIDSIGFEVLPILGFGSPYSICYERFPEEKQRLPR
jgi:hypothetical protein